MQEPVASIQMGNGQFHPSNDTNTLLLLYLDSDSQYNNFMTLFTHENLKSGQIVLKLGTHTENYWKGE